jgi:IS30 family transposase
MDRSISSLSDELKRNRVKGRYDPKKAEAKAYVRRKYAKFQGMKIVTEPELRNFVETHLLEGQSPEAVAGRLKQGAEDLPYASKDTIRRFVKSVHGRTIEALRKKRFRLRKPKRARLADRTFIDQRPPCIAKRSRVGDMEGDFVVSGKSGSGYLLTLIDRKSRYPFIEKIYPVAIENVHRAFLRIKRKFPEWKTLTTDNDILFRKHKELERLLGVKIYFCHPYHSWEKGSIENLNREIRKDIPKGSDLSKRSAKEIRMIEKKLRKRFMECLRYATPEEVLRAHREKQKQRRGGAEKRRNG